MASPPSSALTPAQINQAYGISSTLTGDGTGAAIAIVDAYDDPGLVSRSPTLALSQDASFLASDLHQFDLKYNLPEPAGFFTKVNQSGGMSYPGRPRGDPQRLAIGGSSAGAGLAAGLALKVRDAGAIALVVPAAALPDAG